ncbi:MAG: hypothetical protein ACRELX_16340 [Longimicrobiales bacterium]
MMGSKAIAVGLVLTVTGCMSAPRPIDEPLPYIAVKRPERVWVTRNDGAELIVRRPQMLGDTILGLAAASREEVTVALDETRFVSVRQIDATKTALLVAGLAVAAGLAFAVLAGTGDSLDRDELDRPEQLVVPLLQLRR